MLNQLTFLKNLLYTKKGNSLLCIYDQLRVKLLTHFRVQFSHLKDTMKAYFCYCHGLFYLILKLHLRSFNECFLIQSKKINRLSKGMSNIYLTVTIETFSKLRFSGFKIFFTKSVFGELQLTQISLNFKTSCCNLKIRDLGAKTCMAFPLF